MAKRGAPPKISDTDDRAQLSVEDFEQIAIEHSQSGKHWETLPAAIFKKFGVKVAKDAINGFLRTDEHQGAIKELCAAISVDVLTEEMRSGDLSPAAWIFIKKNKFSWRDRIDTVSEVTIKEEELKNLTNEQVKELTAKVLASLEVKK